MKAKAGLLGLIVLLVTISSTARAQSSRIAFVTDRTTTGDLDVWKMRDDGGSPTEVVAGSGDERHPSISLPADKLLYEYGGDVYITSIDGSGTPTDLTSALTICDDSDEVCGDPDAGPLVGTGGDFRFVFTRKYDYDNDTPPHTVTAIYMATFDRSEGDIDAMSVVLITPSLTPTNGPQLHPVWCGSDHIAWDRQSSGGFYYREICVVPVDENGPTGSETCYGEDDGVDDEYPSCKYDGSKIAWARVVSSYEHDIFVMDCEDLADCDEDGKDNLMEDSHTLDDTHPIWSPSGTQIAFVSDRAKIDDQDDDDLDIWVMNSSNGSGKTPLTDNEDIEDNDPDWGGASLE